MIVFLSYAKKDIDVAKKMCEDLKNINVDLWFDFEKILPGQDWENAIKKVLKKCRIIIALLSSNSVSKQGFVQHELQVTLKLLDESQNSDCYIIPVRVDQCTPSDEKFENLQWVDLFPSYENGIALILKSIEAKAKESSNIEKIKFEAITFFHFKPEELIGSVIEKYQINKHIKSSKYNSIYKSKHTRLNRFACIKISHINPDFNQAISKVFFNGTRKLPKLNHKNIAEIYSSDIWEFESRKMLYIISEFVEGKSLNNYTGKFKGKGEYELAIKIFTEICEGMRSAHEITYYDDGYETVGVLHGNIKSKNVIINEDNSPKIIDFLLADFQRLLDPRKENMSELFTNSKKVAHDSTLVFGSPGYMPPEQEREGIVSRASDIYSLGILLYEIFTGRKIENREHVSIDEIHNDIISENRYASRKISKIIYKATEILPGKRYGAIYEMIDELNEKDSKSDTAYSWDSLNKNKLPILLFSSLILLVISLLKTSIDNNSSALFWLLDNLNSSIGFLITYIYNHKTIAIIISSIMALSFASFVSLRKKQVSHGPVMDPFISLFKTFFSLLGTMIKPGNIKHALYNLIRRRIGPYELKSKIVEGGMGELYLAVNRRIPQKSFIIKIVKKELVKNKNFLMQFDREAELSSSLNHPNIVKIFDYFRKDHAIVMEHVEGRNLAYIIKNYGKLPIKIALYLALQVCAGIHHAHLKNFIHRDIKPGNILISYEGEVKVTDFGIAKALFDSSPESDPTSTIILVKDSIKGTLAYASPEQALRKKVDHRSDIFSFGVIFYEMLSGEMLYTFGRNTNTIEAIRCIAEQETKPICEIRNDVPEDLSEVIMRCLNKKIEDRFQETQEIIDRIEIIQKEMGLIGSPLGLSEFMGTFKED